MARTRVPLQAHREGIGDHDTGTVFEGIPARAEPSHDAKDACAQQREAVGLEDGFAAPAGESEPNRVGPEDKFAGSRVAKQNTRSGGGIAGGARGEGVDGDQDGKSDSGGGCRRGDGDVRYLVQRKVYCEASFKYAGSPLDEGDNKIGDWGNMYRRSEVEVAVEDTNMTQRNHRLSTHVSKTESPQRTRIPPVMESSAWSLAGGDDIQSVAKIRARHVQRQYLREGTWEFLQTQTMEVILEVYYLTRDYHDKDHNGSPRYELLAESAIRILRGQSSEAVDVEFLVPALRLYCREDLMRPDRLARSCMARFLCCKSTLKKLWHHEDYMELMTDPNSAPGMAALLQVALLANL